MTSPQHPQTLPWLEWANLRYRLEWIYDDSVDPIYREVDGYVFGQSALLLRQGSVTVTTRKGEMTVGAGKWLFLNEGIRRQVFSDDTRLLSIRFHWTWPGGLPLFDWDLAAVLTATKEPRLEADALALEKCVRRSYASIGVNLSDAPSDLESYLEAEHLFLGWLRVYASALHRAGYVPSRFEVTDPRILRAIWILDHHPLNQALPEAELAEQVNLSVGQFGRLFTQQFGISPFRYLEKRRLAEAVARVRGSDCSLKAIAIDLGFKSLSHFSFWFRRNVRRAPSDMRPKG